MQPESKENDLPQLTLNDVIRDDASRKVCLSFTFKIHEKTFEIAHTLDSFAALLTDINKERVYLLEPRINGLQSLAEFTRNTTEFTQDARTEIKSLIGLFLEEASARKDILTLPKVAKFYPGQALLRAR